MFNPTNYENIFAWKVKFDHIIKVITPSLQQVNRNQWAEQCKVKIMDLKYDDHTQGEVEAPSPHENNLVSRSDGWLLCQLFVTKATVIYVVYH